MKKYLMISIAVFFFLFLFGTVSQLTSFLVNVKSCVIVLAGTVICSVLSASPAAAKTFFQNLPTLLESRKSNFDELISEISELARIRRSKGLGELEKIAHDIENPFLKQGIEMVVDGYKRRVILSTLEKRFENDMASRKSQDDFIHNLIKLSPIFGFAGTIIGLIHVLQSMSAPEMIGQGMGTALLTTFYGLVFANLLFLPLSRKAADIGTAEAMEKSLIIEGVVDISDNVNSRSIAYRLKSSLGDFFEETEPGRRPEAETLKKLQAKIMMDS